MEEHVVPSDWTAAWQPLIDRIGTDLDGSDVRYSPDLVEHSHIRRYLEPLEFDCALHYDPVVARLHGWRDVIAPYTSAWSFIFSSSWGPGDPPAFAGTGSHEQPSRSAMQQETFPSAPATTHMFGTNANYEFFRPLTVGDRVGVTGRHLLGCVPKQTRVGRGAFIAFSRLLVTEAQGVFCKIELESYLYNPRPATVAEQ